MSAPLALPRCRHATQAMRPPRVVFPVGDCTACTALPSRGVASGMGTLMGAEDAKVRERELTFFERRLCLLCLVHCS